MPASPRLAALVLASALSAACANPPPAATAGAPPAVDVAPVPAAEDPAERYSVYDLGSAWRDQTGATRSLSSLAGRPQVVAMIYTSCAATCPLTVGEMKRVEAAVGGRAGFVLVSLDPEHDTPERLRDFALERALAPERWTLLTGTNADVRDLTAALGVRYRRVSADELAHSNTLTVLDATGAVVDQQAGLEGADATIRAVRALAR